MNVESASGTVYDIPRHILWTEPEFYLGTNYVCLDFEIDTSFGDFGHPVHPENQMLLACWSLGPGHPRYEELGKVYTIWGNEYELGPLIKDLYAADFMVAHNAKYELGWLHRCGFDIASTPVFDTKIAEYVLSGNLKINTSLDSCVRRRGGRCKDPVVDHMMQAGVNPVDIPRPWLSGRCIQDVQTTEDLYLDQVIHLARTNRLGVMTVRCALTPVLADMELQGMKLDDERVRDEYERESENEKELFIQLEDMMSPLSPTSKKDLGQYIYEILKVEELRKNGKPLRTAKKDEYLTDIGTLEKLKLTNKKQKEYFELYFSWNKSKQRIGKYLDFYLAVCNQQDGVFYAQFNQTVSATHRLTSSGERIKFEHVVDDKGNVKEGRTQFQNQPREYKRMYRAKEDGWLISEEDGSGLEFRGAGIVGHCQQIKDDINDPDFDPHRRSASFKFDIPEDEVTKEQRTAGKEITFKPLFGGESGSARDKVYFEAFKERYSDLVETQETWLMYAMNDKMLTLPWGMRFYFPYIKPPSKSGGYIPERAQIFNAPIQSFATADIIPIQATIMWHLIRWNGYSPYMIMVNTVHDSVITEVHPDYQEQYKDIVTLSWKLVYQFIGSVYGSAVLQMMEGMPLGTEIQLGTHWGSGPEVSYEINEDEIREIKK